METCSRRALSREALDMWPRSVFALYTLFRAFLRDEIGGDELSGTGRCLDSGHVHPRRLPPK